MDEHIEECENKHCSFVDVPYKIKWWKTLWFKCNTDCPHGKKLNLEMEQIYNEIKHIEKMKFKQWDALIDYEDYFLLIIIDISNINNNNNFIN